MSMKDRVVKMYTENPKHKDVFVAEVVGCSSTYARKVRLEMGIVKFKGCGGLGDNKRPAHPEYKPSEESKRLISSRWV